MLIAGYQPLTLLDYPGHVASIVFTQGCPFRCVYCHNPELIQTNIPVPHKNEDILKRIKTDRNMLEGVCVTGGEPTSQPDLPEFLGEIKRLGLLVKLDTNGVHPRMIEACLKRRLVDYLAMDLKHVWERYAEIIGKDLEAIVPNCRRTMELIQDSGVPHEFRTTVLPGWHAEEDLLRIAGSLRPGETYALQPVRYEKTLVLDIQKEIPFDLEHVGSTIRERYPSIHLEMRT